MYAKIIFAAALAATSLASAAASRDYDVAFKGEAPVRVTLNADGFATASSARTVNDLPAGTVELKAQSTGELTVRAITRRMRLDDYAAPHGRGKLTLPTWENSEKFLVTRGDVVIDGKTDATDETVVLITVTPAR